MKTRPLPSALVVASAMLVAGIVIGMTMHKYQYFPYRQVQTIVRSVLASTHAGSASLDSQYSLDLKGAGLHRELDTGLLPLTIRGIRVSEEYRFPKGGGAIATVGDSVVILDRLGN